MTTKIVLARHGETEWNKTSRYQGVRDIELNEKGQRQAEKLFDFLKDEAFDTIYSSTLKRAQETVQGIANYQNKEIITISELMEIDFGQWEGLTFSEIEENYPDLAKKWAKDPTCCKPPDGEHIKEVEERVGETIDKIVDDNPDKKILIATHGGIIRIIFAYLLDLPLSRIFSIEVENVSISRIHFYKHYPVVNLLNSIHHLK
ncbi:MAG TPA: alpha-ribazole phosphatase [Halanaerobiales bacterium]|nr:alpha-ribazole phosphatase [Halanaerobiales bacterium]